MIQRRTNTAERSLKKFRLLLVLFIFILILGGACLGYYFHIMQPKNTADTTAVELVIPKGQSLSKTAQILYEKGLIRSPYSLKILAYTRGAQVQAGKFKLSPNMSPAEIIEALNTGKLDYWVTFLEGWRREEFAQALTKVAADNSIDFDPQQFLDVTRDKEGYLFPDTYLFPLDTSLTSIISTLENTLNKNITAEMSQQIVNSGRTRHQVLTMASLIEREARVDASRKLVSGILWKRLDNSWPLQVDATLQYAKGLDVKNQDWWPEPVAADKDIDSPYNTYKYPGLPPGPICAVSQSSLLAAIYPEPSQYWYYISDTEGNMHYATDLAGHNQNINKYIK